MPNTFQIDLQHIADNDVKTLVKKDAEYGSSWKKRGGVGAFMMLARKWDRLETQVTTQRPEGVDKYGILEAIEHQDYNPTIIERDSKPGTVVPDESILESIRDLRRYLLLVEAEIMNRRRVDMYGTGPSLPPQKRSGPYTETIAAMDTFRVLSNCYQVIGTCKGTYDLQWYGVDAEFPKLGEKVRIAEYSEPLIVTNSDSINKRVTLEPTTQLRHSSLSAHDGY